MEKTVSVVVYDRTTMKYTVRFTDDSVKVYTWAYIPQYVEKFVSEHSKNRIKLEVVTVYA